MDKETRLKDRLEKTYKKVVAEVLKSEDQLDAKLKLFQSNSKRIDKSLGNKLKAFEESINELHVDYKQKFNELQKSHKQDLLKLDKEEKDTTKAYEKDLKELDQDLESKRSLNLLKEEKIENDYSIRLETVKKDYEKRQSALDKEIDQAQKKYHEQVTQVQKETEIKKSTQDKLFEEKNQSISKSIDQTNASAKKEIESIESKIKTYETQFEKQITAALKAYKDALVPIDKELDALLKAHEKDLEEINLYYDTEINKKIKYQKEKEKIADHSAASEYGKEVKKLQKTLKETIENKKSQYKQAKVPIDEQRNQTIKNHQELLYELKREGIDKIYLFLNSILVVKTKQLIDINTANIQILEEKAQHEYKVDTIGIDHDIQMVNFTQTLDEAKLYFDSHTERLKPYKALDDELAKKDYNDHTNELTKSRNYVKEIHKKDVKLRKLEHALTLHQIAYEKDRLTEVYGFDKHALNTDKNNHLVSKDDELEQFLIKHYYVHAKNYIALKSDSLLAFKPSIEKEVENRKQLEIKRYQDMIKQAEKDHEIITKNIEETYQHEIKIYETSYNEIEQTHKETIASLLKAQQEELQKDKDAIELLDPKNDRGLIKKQRKALELKKIEFEEIMEEKKVELEERLVIYQKMIDQIKSYRLHSSEEADTLLIHIKDQLNEAIKTITKQSEIEIQRYNNLYYEIKNSADLFDTFQRQREEETLSSSNFYLQTRVKKEEETKAHYKHLLNDALDALKNTFKQFEANNHDEQTETIDNCKKAIEQIEHIKEANLKNILDQYTHEKRRLEGVIAKLVKTYEHDLKQLTQNKDKEKAQCFKRKDDAETLLKETLSIRQKENNAYITERENYKSKDLNRYKEQVNQLLKGLEEDAIDRLNENQVKDIKHFILGDKAIEF